MEESLIDILENDDFYEGESYNHIHKALGLRLASVKLAHLCVDKAKLLDASKGKSISFTSLEERQFAILQLQANKYLKSKGKNPLLLLHLSPRMLLPYNNIETTKNDTVQNEEFTMEVNNSNNNTVMTKKKPRRRRKPRSCQDNHQQDNQQQGSSTEAISMLCEDEDKTKSAEDMIPSVPVSQHNQVDVPRSPPSPATNRSHQRHWLTLSVSMPVIEPVLEALKNEEDQMKLFDLCSMYEREIMTVRETFENAVQAANLKLFIANTEIERLREEMAANRST